MFMDCKFINLVFIIGSGFFVYCRAEDVTFFSCLACSYSYYTAKATGINNCLNDTDRVTLTVPCNSTAACTHSEQIDKRTGQVKSVFRSCQVDRGTRCTPDWTDINCYRSCKSEKCNNRTDLWHDMKNTETRNGAVSIWIQINFEVLVAFTLHFFITRSDLYL